MVSTPIYSFNLTDPLTHNSIYTMPYSLQQSCPRCNSELSKVTLKYNSGSFMLWEAYRNQSACHWLMGSRERRQMQSCQKSGRRTCGIAPAHLSPENQVSSQRPAGKKCICLSACSCHPWSLQFVVDAATDVRWLCDCVAGCVVWLKLFSHWPKLEYQRKVSLSWCCTAAASPPQGMWLLGCPPLVFTWKDMQTCLCKESKWNYSLAWLKKMVRKPASQKVWNHKECCS